jgi:tetratricopeptide (TPR) repeat protein
MIRSLLNVISLFLIVVIVIPILGAENNLSRPLGQVDGNVIDEAHNQVTIILGMQTKNANRSILAKENAMIINRTVDALIAIGISGKNIQMGNTIIQLEQVEEVLKSNESEMADKPLDSIATNQIIIKMNASEDIGRAIDEAISLGSNEILIISSKLKRLYPQAQKNLEGSGDASSKTEAQIAPDVAVKLGNILNVSISEKNDSNDDFDEAFKIDSTTDELESDSAYVWYNRGNGYYAEGRYEEAIMAYNKAIELNPDTHIWYNIGNAALFLGKYDTAIEAYNNAIEIDPSFSDALNNKGEALRLQGNYIEAINAYDRAIELDPLNSYIWSNSGLALYYLGKYDNAIEAFNESLRLHPQFALIWDHKDKAITIDPRLANALIGEGLAFCSKGKYDEAIKAYDKAIYIVPKLAIGWNCKGLALSSQNKDDEALEPYNKAIEMDPDYADAWYNKGIALLSLGNFNEANKCFDKAIELDPKYGISWISMEGATIRFIGPDIWD